MGVPPLKNHKSIGFLSNTGPGPLKNHKATKPVFNVGPTSARWQTDDGPLIVVFVSFLPSSTKKEIFKVGPTLAKLSGSAHAFRDICRLFELKWPINLGYRYIRSQYI